jgi:ClpP class serine protease
VSVLDAVWILFLVSALVPMLQRRRLEMRRLQFLRGWERRTGHRLIALIHRQETMSLLGFPLVRYIDIQDSEELLRALRLTADDVPIDVVLHTPGGLALAAEQIAHAICRRKAKVTVYVPHYAMSGGTLIALAADEIVMDPNAVLGSLDPQLGQHPAASIVRAVEWKTEHKQEIDDETLILADIARKAMV